MGLLTVFEWDTLQLDRRDCRALGALPVRSSTVLTAKLAALGKFLLMLSVPLTLLGGLTFPVIMHAEWRSAVMPAVTVMAAVTWLQHEWLRAFGFGLAALVFAAVTFDAFFLGFGRVPLACPAARESGDPKVLGALIAAVFGTLVVPVAEFITLALRSVKGALIALAFASVGAALLRWRGNLDMTRGGGLAVEPEDHGTQALGIQS
jgi:hypothetical protein